MLQTFVICLDMFKVVSNQQPRLLTTKLLLIVELPMEMLIDCSLDNCCMEPIEVSSVLLSLINSLS